MTYLVPGNNNAYYTAKNDEQKRCRFEAHHIKDTVAVAKTSDS